MAQESRQYECIVLGATGYTGKYTCEHITEHLPTDFKWAIAGRSEAKLESLADELKALNPDRLRPSIETVTLDKDALAALAKKTKVLLTTVGPYHKYGDAVFEACAATGTHYSDVTGEIPWVYEMIRKYQKTAEKTGAIMIPQNGIESAPTDLMCFELVDTMRRWYECPTAEIVQSLHEFKGSASGGTVATLLSLFETYSVSDLAKAQQPWSLCPVPPPGQSYSKPLLERITGIRTVKELGTLTDSIQSAADIPIVNRSWGLWRGGEHYGPRFHLSSYMRARNRVTAATWHILLLTALPALLVPPVRWLLKRLVYQPGEGPSKEAVRYEYAEWHAIAHADQPGPSEPKRIFMRMRWNGSMYHLTGICLAETALLLAREKTAAYPHQGGILTPACLGGSYLERLKMAGVITEVRKME